MGGRGTTPCVVDPGSQPPGRSEAAGAGEDDTTHACQPPSAAPAWWHRGVLARCNNIARASAWGQYRRGAATPASRCTAAVAGPRDTLQWIHGGRDQSGARHAGENANTHGSHVVHRCRVGGLERDNGRRATAPVVLCSPCSREEPRVVCGRGAGACAANTTQSRCPCGGQQCTVERLHVCCIVCLASGIQRGRPCA